MSITSTAAIIIKSVSLETGRLASMLPSAKKPGKKSIAITPKKSRTIKPNTGVLLKILPILTMHFFWHVSLFKLF
jgi:D-arabinose 5-phosphate isomerase GutQ